MADSTRKFGKVYLYGKAVELESGALMGTGLPKIWRNADYADRWIAYAKDHGLEAGEGARPVTVAIVEVLE